jgi:hypothetical protein
MRYTLALVIMTCLSLVSSAADLGSGKSPESVIMDPVRALRSNDMLGWIKSLPDDKRADVEMSWLEATANTRDDDDAGLDQYLALLTASNAVDSLMAIFEPEVARFDPVKAADGLEMFGRMLAVGMASDPTNSEFAQAVQLYTQDLSIWMKQAGLNDPQKARQALTAALDGLRATKITTAAELRALTLDQLLQHTGTLIKELKVALAVYDLDVDKALDSVTVIKIEGDGDERTARVEFTAFGHTHKLPVKLLKLDGEWVCDAEAMGLDGMLDPTEQLEEEESDFDLPPEAP